MANTEQRFLDNLNGVPTLWGRIKEYFALKKDIPTKVSTLNNDSNYQNATQVETAITEKGYQNATQVETAITEKGYQTSAQVESAIAEKGYQTSAQVESAIAEKGYQTSAQVETAITKKGYQTSAQVETAITKKGYQTANDVSTAISTALTGAIKYKGSVANAEALPSNPANGDMYNIIADSTYGPAGTNVAWSSTENRWDAQGGSFIVSAMTAADVNSICTDPSTTTTE